MLNSLIRRKYLLILKWKEYVARAEGVVTAAEFLGFSTPSKVSDTIKDTKKASKKVDSAIEEINMGKEILKGSIEFRKKYNY